MDDFVKNRNLGVAVLAEFDCDPSKLSAEIVRLRAQIPEWQPIETAPRDGTVILIWANRSKRIVIAKPHVNYDGGNPEEDWTWQEAAGGMYGIIATHWMPTPPEPDQ